MTVCVLAFELMKLRKEVDYLKIRDRSSIITLTQVAAVSDLRPTKRAFFTESGLEKPTQRRLFSCFAMSLTCSNTPETTS